MRVLKVSNFRIIIALGFKSSEMMGVLTFHSRHRFIVTASSYQ